MTENATERTAVAEAAKDAYLALAVNEGYHETPDMIVAEGDAFIAGWDAAVAHLIALAEDLDVPTPVKAIAVSMLDANRAERLVR